MIVLNPIIEPLRSQQQLPETQQLYEMVQGEFKHGVAYDINIATIQCFAYLYSALYWIRVVQGFPLESVYGFGVCGHKCRGMKSSTCKEYAVGFFRLSVPSHLGERFKAES